MLPETVGGAVAVTAFGWGFRHGFDVDHVAALADLTQTARSRRRGVLASTAYIVGHALVVVALSILWIAFGRRLPAGVDAWMGRIVGLTIVALGATLLVGMAKEGRFVARSRVATVAGAVRSLRRRLRREAPAVAEIVHAHPHLHDAVHGHGHDHEGTVPPEPIGPVTTAAVATAHAHLHVHRVPVPEDPLEPTGPITALAVGAVHGLGAETPTQLLVLATAAGAATTAASVTYVLVFIIGVAAANTLVAVGLSLGVLDPDRHPTASRVLGAVVGTTTVAAGLAMLAGVSLPGLA